MPRCVIHFYNSWEEWSNYYCDSFDYYNILDDCYKNPYMKVIYRGTYSWVYIEEEYYDQEEDEEEVCDYQ